MEKLDHPGLMDGILRGIDPQGNEIFDEKLTALVENDAIHMFSHELGRR
jgi:hypothetical protein